MRICTSGKSSASEKNEDPTQENLKKLQEFAGRHGEYVVKPVYAAFGKGSEN